MPTNPSAPTPRPAAGRPRTPGLQALLAARPARVAALSTLLLLLPSLAAATTPTETAQVPAPDPGTAYEALRAKANARIEAALGREALGEAGRTSAWIAPRALGEAASQLFASTDLRVSVDAGQRRLPSPPTPSARRCAARSTATAATGWPSTT